MAIRMKDVAQDLGLSVITISKVLRNHSDISSATRERVLRRMKELNYRPNLAARALVTGKSYLMGLVVPDLVHPFFSQLAKGVSKVLRKKGYGLIMSSSEEDPDLERQELEQLMGRGLDVYLIASAQSLVDSFQKIEEHGRPYILIDRKFTGLDAHFVGTDDRAIGRMATEHLIENRCRRIAFIGGRDTSPVVDRMQGYREVLAEKGLRVPDAYVRRLAHGDDSADETGYEAMRVLLSADEPPDGVFCYNDPSAMGAMRAILEAGFEIPGDIAIVGCGNLNYAPLLRVPLSSVDQQSELMGERAAKLALALTENKAGMRKAKSILMQPALIARESSIRNT